MEDIQALSKLPLHQMVAQGWDVSKRAWRLPIHANLDWYLKDRRIGSRRTAFRLEVTDSDDEIAKEGKSTTAGDPHAVDLVNPLAELAPPAARVETPTSRSSASSRSEAPTLTASSSLSSIPGSEGLKTPTQEEPMGTSTLGNPGTSKTPHLQPAFLAQQELAQLAGTEVWQF
ncbi:hypothetical protein C8R46DRAFT_1074826 [Mycena filopes]|nr:hypothetical protein C8R46DRAFT_1074826 [Mycena filopes]